MINLILAVVSSTLIAVLMRASEGRVKNRMVMFAANYAVCTAMSRVFMGSRGLFESVPGLDAAVIIGLISGGMYLGNFIAYQGSIRRYGVVLSSTVMKLGVIIPTLAAVILWGETMRPLQAAAILLSLAAIFLTQYEKNGDVKKFGFGLALLLLLSGTTDLIAKIYDKTGTQEAKDLYLFITFAAAGVISLILSIVKKERIREADLLFGVLIGIPNYFSSRFLLGALHTLPAVIVYPSYSVGTIALTALIGLVIFREKLTRRKLLAVGIICLALVLINI